MATKPVIYKFQNPETGKTYQIEGDADTTEDEAMAHLDSLADDELTQYELRSSPSVMIGAGQSQAPVTQTEAVRPGEQAEANLGFGPEETAKVQSMMADPSISYDQISQYTQERSKALNLPYMSLGGSPEELAEYRKGLAQGYSEQPFGYQTIEQTIPDVVTPTVTEEVPAGEPTSVIGKVDTFAKGLFNHIERGYQDAIQYGTSGLAANLYHDWMDTGETELRSMFPNASDDQIEEMQSAVVNLTQKRIRGANEEELQNDPLFPWLMGQLVGSVGVEDLAPGSIGGSLGARVASGAAVNAGADAAYQNIDVARGVQEEYNPEQTALAAVLGGGLHAGTAALDRLVRTTSQVAPDHVPSNESVLTAPTGDRRSKKYKTEMTASLEGMAYHVNTVADKWTNKPEFAVHQNFKDLKGIDKDAVAVVLPDGSVAVNAERVFKEAKSVGVSPENILTAMTFHEGLGHHGLSLKFGNDLDDVLNNFYDNGAVGFKRQVDQWKEDNPDAYEGRADAHTRAIEEVFAEMSERGRIPVKMKDKVLNIVKDYARQMGFNLSYSRRELKAVLGMAHSKVISGEAAEAGTGVSPRYIYAGLKSRLASWPESTGKGDWFTGPDGVDRYEIDDSQSRFDDERFQEFNEYNKSLENGDQAIERLGNLLDHPELYEAYPQLKDTEVRVLPESEGFGQYDERRNILHLSMSATDKHSTALHEVQHAIQKIEDMGRGGDPDSALRRMSADHLQDTLRNVIEWDTKRLDVEGQRLDTLKEIAATQEAYDARQLKVATQKMEAARNYLRQQLDEEGYTLNQRLEHPEYDFLRQEDNRLTKEYFQAIDNLKAKIGYPENPTKAEVREWENLKWRLVDLEPEATIYALERDLMEDWDYIGHDQSLLDAAKPSKTDLMDALRRYRGDTYDIKYQAYQSIFGEVEARDVQARMKMTPAERKRVKPYSSQEGVAPASSYIIHRWEKTPAYEKAAASVSMRDDPQNTPNDPAVKLTAELLGVPVDRIPRALEESDFLGQVFLTRREMQNPKAPRYMRKYQPTEADDIETSKHIIESALEHYVPTVRPWNEARRLARESGMTAAQIRKASKSGVAELDKRMFIYDQVAQQTSEKLAVLHQKQLDGSFTPADKAKYLQTIFQYNEMMGRIFEDQAEIARGLAAMRAIQHTKNKYGELNKMLSDLQGQDNLKAFASEDVFNSFTDQVKYLMATGNQQGVNKALVSVTKPYWWQYGLSFRHSMMLSGLGTHYKNAKDNAMMIARELEEQAMSVPGFALRKGLKGAGVDVLEGTSPQEVVGRVYGLLNSALDSKTYQDTYQAFMKGRENRHVSSKLEMADARIPVLSKVQDTLHAADTFFRAFHSNANLYTLGVREARTEGFNGVAAFLEGSDRAANPSKAMLEEATRLSDISLLVDKPSILTSLLEGVKAIRPGMTWGHQAVAATANIMFPFFRVTDRLLFQAIRRTPLGFLDARTMEDLKAGGARMDIALARMSYGSALMYYYWTQAGDRDTIEGKGPRNYKKVQALEAGGYKPNSTIEDGKYVDASALNLSWLPEALNNSVATNIASIRQAYDQKKATGEDTAIAIASAMMTLTSILSSQSFAENLAQYTEPMNARSDEEELTIGANIVGSLGSSLVPAALRQYNQAVHDPIKRDTTGDKTFLDRVYGRIASGIPGLSEQLPAKHDLYGDEMQQGRSLSGAGNYQDIKTDDVSQELQRLERTTESPVVTGAPSSFQYEGEKIGLPADAKQEWQRVQGYLIREYMKIEMADPSWKETSDEDKIAIVKAVKKDAYQETKDYMLPLLGLEPEGDEE